MSDPTPAGPTPAKKKPLLLIIAVVVLLAGAGGGAWFFMKGKPAEAAESADSDDASDSAEATTQEKPKAKKKKKGEGKKLSERGLVKMEPFIVNLADEGGKRFLRASIQLVVENAKEAAEFTEKPVLTAGARSAIVDTLTTQTAESIGTPEGKEELRGLLREKVSDVLSMEIVDVLLSDFVVQY
jgi:flagellar protein FliL